MAYRPGHYMKQTMLESQFRDLEAPAGGLHIDVSNPPEEITQQIVNALEMSTDCSGDGN